MYFKLPNNKKTYLKVEDDFATLLDVIPPVAAGSSDLQNQNPESTLKFQFEYSVSQIKALEENALVCEITVKKKNKLKPYIVPSTKSGPIDSQKLIDNILFQKINISNVIENDKSSIIVKKISDISAKINNQLLGVIKSNGDVLNAGIKKTKVVVEKKSNLTKDSDVDSSLTSQVGYSSSTMTTNDSSLKVNIASTIDAKKTRLQSLYVKQNSPAQVSDYTPRSISVFSGKSGIIRKNKKNEFAGDPSVILANSYLFDNQLDDVDEYVTTVKEVIDDTIIAKVDFSFPESLSAETTLLVNFELKKRKYDSSGKVQFVPIEKVEKNFNIQEQMKAYFYPVAPPNVGVSKNDSYISFRINQKDEKANAALIYKRAINDGDLIRGYTRIASVTASSQTGEAYYRIPNVKDNLAIYRVIPYNRNSNVVCSEFTDVIVKDIRIKEKKLILVPRSSEGIKGGGVKVSAYNYFPDIVAAKLLIKDVTTGQKDYHVANEIFSFSSNESRSEIIVRNLVPYHRYEFTTKLITEHGEEYMSSHKAFLQYMPRQENPFDVSISKPSLISTLETTQPDVKFLINAAMIEDQIGMLERLFNRTLTGKYDLNLLKSQKKAEYDKLIAFNVIRYNLTTGDVDDLGIIGNGTGFVDSQEAVKRGAKRVQVGNDYKYICYPLVRDPVTVEGQVENITDEETRKSYQKDNRKHLHPTTLINGSVVSKNYLKNSTKQEMMHGMLGISYEVDALFSGSKSKITDLLVRRIGNKNYISWKMRGSSVDVDHIVIAKSIGRKKTIIGKSHMISEFQTYIHEISEEDLGAITYELFPVYMDYSSGELTKTKPIIIDKIK